MIGRSEARRGELGIKKIGYGKADVRVVDVPEPEILNEHDAVLKITSTAICGSDLHLYNGFVPTMEKGGHSRSRVYGRNR